jgi:flavin-dependent dehydrogenase
VPAGGAVPAALGIEEDVASYSTLKPGATFRFGLEDVLMFRFNEVRGARTTYSYNVPRDRFDASIRDAALAAGARLVPSTRASSATDRASGSGSPTRASPRGPHAAARHHRRRGRPQPQLARLLDLPVVQGDRATPRCMPPRGA